ncbi:VOC family protein [Streptomyces sp. NBC_00103]|uniref:VOC family protein n=1 Tax=Streptomyces sp. NBC_00103 TaxID=2975653 RepID=UPI00225212DD|nr:VOC family protein [Streptomyces sp. NBC_00103]MCX5369341.1 hypothetical protein [Streptomyces sp. NBC_00103]
MGTGNRSLGGSGGPGAVAGRCSRLGLGPLLRRRVRDPPGAGPPAGVGIRPARGDQQGKSRLHLDFRPDDQGAEVARLEARGAKRVDIGQGDRSWVVMADPEGNEFCVLGPRRE